MKMGEKLYILWIIRENQTQEQIDESILTIQKTAKQRSVGVFPLNSILCNRASSQLISNLRDNGVHAYLQSEIDQDANNNIDNETTKNRILQCLADICVVITESKGPIVNLGLKIHQQIPQ